MAGPRKQKTASKKHEGCCTLCAAVVEVERVQLIGAKNGMFWRCKANGHLEVERGSVRVTNE